jgi:hypothetical protein
VKRPSRRAAGNLVALAFALTFALALAEGVLRVAWEGRPQFHQPDPVRGAGHIPGAHGWYTLEGRGWVEINSAGLRDREHALAKPPDTLRIAVLGDSYTEALQVDRESAFWAVAERELAQCPALAGRVVEAINFGVSGFGTAQQLQTLRHLVWDYDPDVVVVAFLTGNDVRNNSRALEPDAMRPYFVVEEGKLVLDDSFLEGPEWRRTQSVWWRGKQWLLQRSHVVQMAFRVRDVLRQKVETPPPAIDQAIYAEPKDAAWVQAWDVTERMLRAMNEEVAAHGAAFQLLVLTNPWQVHPDPAVRARAAAEAGVTDLLYPDRRVEAFARSAGIPVLALVDRFRREAESSGRCLHGFENALLCGGHWNAEGHRLGGELLAAELCERLGGDAAGLRGRSGRR